MKFSVNLEKWKSGQRFVVRYKGKIIESKTRKGSGLSLSSARDRFKKRGTFSTEYTRKRKDFGNVIQVEQIYDTGKDPGKFPKVNHDWTLQYVVGSETLGNPKIGIWGRSDKASEHGWDYQKSKTEAEKRFYSNVAYYYDNNYDADEGFNLVKKRNVKLRRGVVWYMLKKKRNASGRQNRR